MAGDSGCRILIRLMTYRVDLALLACACVAYAWLIVVVLFGRTH